LATAVFRFLPSEEAAPRALVAAREIFTAVALSKVSTRSRRISFWAARSVELPGLKNTLAVALVLWIFQIANSER
jgi:hypothetical protein